jgi:hypothetical protein
MWSTLSIKQVTHTKKAQTFLPISSFTLKNICSTSFSIGENKSAWSVRSISIFWNVIETIRKSFDARLWAIVQCVVTRLLTWIVVLGRWWSLISVHSHHIFSKIPTPRWVVVLIMRSKMMMQSSTHTSLCWEIKKKTLPWAHGDDGNAHHKWL